MRSVPWIVLLACDPGAHVASMTPDLEGAQSLVIAVRTEEGIEVEARSHDHRPIRLLASDPAVVEIAAYDRSLASLGLAEGELVKQEGGERLPLPALVYEGIVDDGELRWTEKEEMSIALSEFTVEPPRSRCVLFETVATSKVPFTYDSVVFDDQVYLGGPSGLSRLSEDGAEKLMLDPELNVRGMAVDPAGSVWLSVEGGSFHRGDLSFTPPRVEPIYTATSGESMSWMAAGFGEVFTMSNFGVVERFDGTRSRVIYRFPRDHTLGAAVARVREGEMVAVHQLYGTVMRWRDGDVSLERIGSTDLVSFNAAAQVPGLGTVIATEIGRFFVDDGSGWRDLGDSMYSLRVLTIQPTEHGFLWGGEIGVVGEYRHDSGFCMPQTLHPQDVWNVQEAGGRIYLVNRGDDGIADLTVLRR